MASDRQSRARAGSVMIRLLAHAAISLVLAAPVLAGLTVPAAAQPLVDPGAVEIEAVVGTDAIEAVPVPASLADSITESIEGLVEIPDGASDPGPETSGGASPGRLPGRSSDRAADTLLAPGPGDSAIPAAPATTAPASRAGSEAPAGLRAEGRALGLPLILLGGIGLFLVLSGRSTVRSSKLSDAPLRSAGSLVFPEIRP